MPRYPSREWLQSWTDLANRSPDFRAAGEGWSGAVGLAIEADPTAGVGEPLYMRLDGRDGVWTDVAFGREAQLAQGTVFTIRAPYVRWKQVIRQELHPLKGILQGKLVLVGHMPVVLRWVKAITVLVRLAGQVQTEFVDERADVTPGRGDRGA